MAKEVCIPIIRDTNKNIFVYPRFPEKCIYCGKAQETYIGLRLIDLFSSWTNEEHSYSFEGDFRTELKIPYCKEHAEEARRNHSILVNIQLGCSSLVFLFVFFLILYFTNFASIYIMGALVFAFVAAFIVWRIAKTGLRYLLLPLFKKSFKFSSFQGNPNLGIEIFISKSHEFIIYKFANNKVAEEFAELNIREILGISPVTS